MLNATNLGFEMTDHRVRILVGMNQFEDAGAALPRSPASQTSWPPPAARSAGA
ncbi:MAG: hypothetical protein R3B70_14765 [Polyangiaceae bacterium]